MLWKMWLAPGQQLHLLAAAPLVLDPQPGPGRAHLVRLQALGMQNAESVAAKHATCGFCAQVNHDLDDRCQELVEEVVVAVYEQLMQPRTNFVNQAGLP